MAPRNPHTTVVVFDANGSIYEALRGAGDHLRVERSDERASRSVARTADLAVVATYDHTDWTAAMKLQNEIPTIIVSARYDERRAARALASGLDGYLDAGLPPTSLTRALRGALDGELAYPRAVLGRWVRWQRATADVPLPRPLTHRQAEVLVLVARGATDKEIAGVLGISTATAQKHVANILARLGVPNRAAAAALLRTPPADAKGPRTERD